MSSAKNAKMAAQIQAKIDHITIFQGFDIFPSIKFLHSKIISVVGGRLFHTYKRISSKLHVL